jgi:predicted ATPase
LFRPLAEEKLLVFDAATATWRWDLEQIRSRGFSGNISELVTDKLGRLSDATLQILKQLACLGSSTAMSTIRLLTGESAQSLDALVLEAVQAGLVSRLNGSLKFVHDRVQQAAYPLPLSGSHITIQDPGFRFAPPWASDVATASC